MEEEKNSKQKPHTSFNKRLSVAKNPEGNMTTAKKNVKKFILQGEHDKGEYGKGYYGIYFCQKILLDLVNEKMTYR